MRILALRLLIIFSFFAFSFSLFAQEPVSEEKKENEKSTEKENKAKSEDKKSTVEAETEKTLKIGNLAFPTSQQPTPLVSFGQHNIEKKQAQALLLAFDLRGKDKYWIDLQPNLIYAFTDQLALFLVAPIAVRKREDGHHSSGPEDAVIQLEYAYYTKAYRTYYDQATFVAGLTIPTGSNKKRVPTGTGSNSFFVGGTFSRMGIDWFYFASPGGVINASSHRNKAGNQFLYQCGVGRRITSTKEWLFDWMIEFDGIYSWKDKNDGMTDPDSGGNVIYDTPSLFLSTKENFLVQFGIGFPVHQHLFGHQNKDKYMLLLNTGWTF